MFSGVNECAVERDFRQRAARAWGFARLQLFGKLGFVADLAERNRCFDTVAGRNTENLDSLVEMNAGHAVGLVAVQLSLMGDGTPGSTCIEAVAIGRLRFRSRPVP